MAAKYRYLVEHELDIACETGAEALHQLRLAACPEALPAGDGGSLPADRGVPSA